MADRTYALTKLAPGDYLMPSNDTRTLWRIARYTDGPSGGLDWPRDREVWGIWKWPEPIRFDGTQAIDCNGFEPWDFMEGLHETRAAAINSALELSPNG